MKQCNKCKEWKPLEQYHKHSQRSDGLQSECTPCRLKYHAGRMWVNGEYIPSSHPLHKPGRYKSLDDAWSHLEIDSRTKQGEVYVISNQAWDGWYKVGKAVCSKDRCRGYQTSSPLRDYELLHYTAFDNRHHAESAVHRKLREMLDEDSYNGEWFSASLDAIIDIIEGVKYEEANAGHRDEPSPQHDLGLCHTGR